MKCFATLNCDLSLCSILFQKHGSKDDLWIICELDYDRPYSFADACWTESECCGPAGQSLLPGRHYSWAGQHGGLCPHYDGKALCDH